jgi:DNA-binding transcriptional MerR regulator
MEQAVEKFLEAADVARVVGITAAAVNFHADRGRLVIAARTLRGSRLYRLQDVQEFLARRRSVPAGEAAAR